ncbi:hypothetical protein EHM69_05395 [candidate division KSB1 bacterium]|nr:MAG: hypothetical protein EHM69_05395 [candidate division KSB1 bacterium]
MSDMESLENRMQQIERKLDDLALRIPMSGETSKAVRRRGRTSRVFWGIFILALGFIWLGQNFGIEWLNSLRFWPVAVIVFGVYLIFGDRNW